MNEIRKQGPVRNSPQERGYSLFGQIKRWVALLLELGKFKITFSVTITTAAGYFLSSHPYQSNPIWPVLGILFIGLSSASLNQWQERDFDAKMNRTRTRPLPEGRVKPYQVFIIVIAFFILGVSILHFKTNPISLILGISAFVWYNGIYTLLKRVSSIAVVPGALIGGLPPALGWTAAGGSLTDPFILSISLFLIIWQVPHFWLLLFLYGEDYRRAGFPVLQDRVSEKTLGFMTFLGVFLTIVSGISIPYAAGMRSLLIALPICIVSIYIVQKSLYLLRATAERKYKQTFIMINIYTVFVLFYIVIVRFVDIMG
jgi:protoheme IX farnesyltransferase